MRANQEREKEEEEEEEEEKEEEEEGEAEKREKGGRKPSGEASLLAKNDSFVFRRTISRPPGYSLPAQMSFIRETRC